MMVLMRKGSSIVLVWLDTVMRPVPGGRWTVWCSNMSAPVIVVEFKRSKTALEKIDTIPNVADLPYSPHGASSAFWLSCSSGSINESMLVVNE